MCNSLAHHPLHNTRAPPLVQEKPHVQMPCTPPLVQRPCTPPRVQHPVCTTPRARGAPSCKCLAHHPSCTTPRARGAPRANALHNTPCAPPLVQEEPPRANALHTTPCATPLHTTPCATPSVHHPSCKRSPTCKCLAHHPSCTTSGRRARSTAVRGRRATPSCNAAPQWLERRWRGGGVCRKSQPNSLRIH